MERKALRLEVQWTLQEVLKTTLIHKGQAHGIRKDAEALHKRQARLCVLASNCDELAHVRLVEALCVNLTEVDDSKKLGECVGLCKIDREGKTHNIAGYSCVLVKDYGKKSQAMDIIGKFQMQEMNK